MIKTQNKNEYYQPAELTGFMINYLAGNAEAIYGPISDIVVTTPAFYQSTRRNIVKKIGLYIFISNQQDDIFSA